MNVPLPPYGSPAQSRIREVSRAVFGGAFVLEALVVMAREERFYGTELADLTGCEGSYAAGLLKRLSDAGLIEALPKEPGQARKYYRARDSALWDFVVTWLGELSPPDDGELKRIA